MAGKGSGGSSFFLRNASHSAWREASCANSSVRPTGSASGTAIPRLSNVALIAWASRSVRSEEHTSELQSLMRISYAVFCLKKKKKYYNTLKQTHTQIHSS